MKKYCVRGGGGVVTIPTSGRKQYKSIGNNAHAQRESVAEEGDFSKILYGPTVFEKLVMKLEKEFHSLSMNIKIKEFLLLYVFLYFYILL